MFGVVPRTLWGKVKPPDEQNRIRMGTNCLLVERGRDLLLVDTGIGDKHEVRFREIYGMEEGAERLPESIRRAGYELGDVTHVLLSHLHFDHCGWNTREHPGGSGGSSPPSRVPATGWRAARSSTRGTRTSATGRATTRATGSRCSRPAWSSCSTRRPSPCPGVRAVRAPGHNRGHGDRL